MHWKDLPVSYPAQWLVIELVDRTSTAAADAPASAPQRHDAIEVIEVCGDGCVANHRTSELRRAFPRRAFVFVHTSYPSHAFDPASPVHGAAAPR